MNASVPPCPGCGRQIASRTKRLTSNKGGRVPHNCPHHIICYSGQPFSGGGWNPGDRLHAMHCEECAALARAAREKLNAGGRTT